MDKMKGKYYIKSINPGLCETLKNGRLLRFLVSMPLPKRLKKIYN